jgi:DNA replicative helicase MCM subunit Mcm2 (Cdc46/Mcm family)
MGPDRTNRSVMMKSSANMSNVQSASILDADPKAKINLAEKLRINPGDDFDPIPQPLLRKVSFLLAYCTISFQLKTKHFQYIMFAKRTCDPKIGDDATKELTAFYVHLRQNSLKSNGCIPITMRQLESLMRLTHVKNLVIIIKFFEIYFILKKARAKCELRTLCTGDDAREVIEIMKAGMVDYNENELGMLNFPKSLSKSGKSKSSFIESYLDELLNMAKKKKSKMFHEQELKNLYEVCKTELLISINF